MIRQYPGMLCIYGRIDAEMTEAGTDIWLR